MNSSPISVLLVSSLSDSEKLVEPVAMEYLAAYLIKHHYPVTIHCCLPDESYLAGILAAIEKNKVTVVGLTMWVINADFVVQVCKKIKVHYPEITTVVGGYHARFAATVPDAVIDHFLLGEGEISFLNLVQSIENGLKVERIIEGESVKNLDELPLPARHLVDFSQFDFLEELKDPVVLKPHYTFVFTYRGCPLSCTFCGIHEVYSKQIRKKSVQRVMEELYEISNKYQINAFVNEEDLLFLDKKWLLAWCDALCRFEYKFSWTCSGTVRYMDEEILLALKSAGCKYVFLGSISGSDTILKKARVGFNTQHLQNALEVAYKAKMPISSSFMIGFPEETIQTLHETSKFLKTYRHLYWDVGMGIVRPYSGTPLLNNHQTRSTPQKMLSGDSLSPVVDIITLEQFIDNHRDILDFKF
jgi:anaerobic magnesium-protoporphyrin IX monomethyl ester cyclase